MLPLFSFFIFLSRGGSAEELKPLKMWLKMCGENCFFTVRQTEVKVRDLGKSDIFNLMQVQLNYKDRIIRKQNW